MNIININATLLLGLGWGAPLSRILKWQYINSDYFILCQTHTFIKFIWPGATIWEIFYSHYINTNSDISIHTVYLSLKCLHSASANIYMLVNSPNLGFLSLVNPVLSGKWDCWREAVGCEASPGGPVPNHWLPIFHWLLFRKKASVIIS